ncbi:hypothetical protein ACLBWX_05500 [Methylobacterium sp. M6A4_1b]
MAELRPLHPTKPLPPLNAAVPARQFVPGRSVAMIARGLAVIAGLGLTALGLRYAGRGPTIDGTVVADATKAIGILAPRLRTAGRMASIPGPSSAQ